MTGKYLKGECQQCGGHIEFPAEAAGTTTECPHCGKTTDLLLSPPPAESSIPPRFIVYIVVAVVILVGSLIATLIGLKRFQRMADEKKEAAAVAAKPARPLPAPGSVVTNGFHISPITLEKTPGSSLVYAAGTVRNESARRRFGVRVELDLLDETGQKVGSAKDYQQTLESKGEWRFRALVVGSKVATAKLASITEDQ